MAVASDTLTAPFEASRSMKPVTTAFVVTALCALFIGSMFGPLQAFNYAGINLYPVLGFHSYYEDLTLHGVLNALVFTTFFNCGVLSYFSARELGETPNRGLLWLGYWTMAVGVVLAAIAIFSGRASVLYTFYPPLQAWWPFYVGAALLVVGSLIVGGAVILHWMSWKRRHPDQLTPLLTHMSVATWLMWTLAALGIAVEVVVFLIPWSLGMRAGVDPLLARTLFWFTGHAIVYFWLLPAYVSWYALVPHQAGGRLISDTAARMSFVLFLLFSIPVGLHHQLEDAGISMWWKMAQMTLTFFVIVPSLLTAFTVGASLETAGRARGGDGWLGWFWRLPWSDPSVSAQVLAMLTFIIGGATGIVLASGWLNVMVHNTVFIPGHFHLTVGTAVAMTFIGMSFWWVPHLTGKPLFAKPLAHLTTWCWFFGMIGVGCGLMTQGVLTGVPRRDWISELPHDPFVSGPAMTLTAVGGALLAVALIAYMIVIFGTLLRSRSDRAGDVPAIPYRRPQIHDGALVRSLDHLLAWAGVALVIIVIFYGPVLYQLLTHQVLIHGMSIKG